MRSEDDDEGRPTLHLEACTAIAQKLAGEAYNAFETRTRDNGEKFVTLKDGDTPEWIRDAVYAAHGDHMPDDWRYDKIQDAFGAIHDASEDADIVEVGDEFADGAVDIYPSARFEWLASHLNRQYYCDDAVSEGLVEAESDLVQRVGMGQYMEAREIFAEVVSALSDQVEACQDEYEENEKRERIRELETEIEEARRLGRDPQRQLCELANLLEELGEIEDDEDGIAER